MTEKPADKEASEKEASKGAPDELKPLTAPSDPGLMQEFLQFLMYNKKWWLAPILVIMLLLTLLVFLSASPVAPFIYTLF